MPETKPLARAVYSPLWLPRAVLDQVVRHARACDPEECCGLLLGEDTPSRRRVDDALACRNEAPPGQRRVRYQIAPRAYLEAQRRARGAGLSIVGVYHSHPNGPAEPSPVDRELAWPGYSYLIVAGRAAGIQAAAWVLCEHSAVGPRLEPQVLITPRRDPPPQSLREEVAPPLAPRSSGNRPL